MKEFKIEFEKIKEDCLAFNLNEITLTFTKSVKEAKAKAGDKRSQEIYDKNPVDLTMSLEVLDLFIEAAEGKTDPEIFEERVNDFLGLKPHEFLLVNRRVYKKNTVAFNCKGTQCENCLNFITCQRNSIGKIFLVLELQPTYARIRKTDYRDGIETHTFGDMVKNIVKRKQNELFEILSSKIFFYANRSNLKNGGR